MDVLTALIAVLIGWLLGYGQQSWRDRREAQLATRLLVDELLFSKAELVNHRDNLDWTVFGRSATVSGRRTARSSCAFCRSL